MSSPQDTQNSTDATSDMTPEAREIIRRAKRSFGFSIAILLLGFIAIVIALVYRSTRDSAEPVASYVQTEISLPAGSELISVVPSSNHVTITYQLPGKTLAKIIDSQTGAVLHDITISTE
jgi:hypothetical protein